MSNYFTSLFSFGSNKNSMNDFFSNISQYSSINNGSYKKALTSYYKKAESNSDNASAVDKIIHANKNNSLVSREEVKEVKTDTDALKKSAQSLITTGTKSLFTKKEVTTTDETTGEKTTSLQYDTSAIANAVKSFAKDYNSTLATASDISSDNVSRYVSYMEKQTKVFEKSLNKVGITIGSDNKLSVDETKLKNADMNMVKSLFNGSSSFAYLTSQKASQIQQAAVNTANQNYLYNNSATLTNNNYFNSFNSYF